MSSALPWSAVIMAMPPIFSGGVHHLAHAGVHGLHGLDGSVKHAGVAHHVAVGEVQDDDVILAALDALHALVADLEALISGCRS